MKYEVMNKNFILEFPEFQSSYDEFFLHNDSEPQYPFFEGYVANLLQLLLDMKDNNLRRELLERLFIFILKMMTADDNKVNDLAFISFFEYKENYWLSKAAKYMDDKLIDLLQIEIPSWDVKYPNYKESPRKNVLGDAYGLRINMFRLMESEGLSINDIPILITR